ncbi:flagellin [Aeoliella mucimassa]|uniref:Flagellin n=1 Tax=Aeoliella mucimassa TaxID=2527972 RepID=A0A518AVZ5_9BACT|nr:flagellin [Aeoliella mucimassa]QDU58861.1 Flagellin [Aeoliella mucimassa]
MISPLGQNSSAIYGQLINNHNRNARSVFTATERLSTGKQINHASDDPAGLIAAEKIRGDIVELNGQSRASSYERSQLHIRESAITQVQGVLNEVRGVLVSAADGFNSPSQLTAYQQQIDASLDAIDQIANGTTGVSNSAALYELRSGGAANVVDGDMEAALALVEDKQSAIVNARAAIGAYERAELDTIERLREDQQVINLQTLSTLEDADFATETANLARSQTLTKASIALLALTNRDKESQMRLLLNI